MKVLLKHCSQQDVEGESEGIVTAPIEKVEDHEFARCFPGFSRHDPNLILHNKSPRVPQFRETHKPCARKEVPAVVCRQRGVEPRLGALHADIIAHFERISAMGSVLKWFGGRA